MWYYPLSRTAETAQELLDAYPDARVWALVGELGAGKTTLIRALCELWGVQSTVNSPTFTIVQTYSTVNGAVHHFDLYRLKDASELEAIDFESYLHAGERCVIEWPEIAADYLPKGTVLLKLYHAGPEERRLEARLLIEDPTY